MSVRAATATLPAARVPTRWTYRFNPNGAEGSQWEAVSGYGGEKRYFGTAFVIDEVAYICCGRNNSTDLVDFWKFDGSNWTQLRDIADTDSDNDYDDDYAITRSEAVSFVIGGRDLWLRNT